MISPYPFMDASASLRVLHQMGAEAPSGPSVRLAISAYNIINMNNSESPSRRFAP